MNTESSSQASQPAPTPAKTLVMLAAIVVVIGIFLALCHVLGVTDFWAGFLFVLYWGMFEGTDTKKLPHCILGALVGLLLGFLMQTLPQVVGPSGGLIFLGLVLVIIYCQLMSWLPMAVNAMTMIFLTVGTIPALQAHTDFFNALLGLVLGVVYFGGLISVGKLIKERAGDS